MKTHLCAYITINEIYNSSIDVIYGSISSLVAEKAINHEYCVV